MVILIICQIVENHPSVHFLHISRILREITSQGKQIIVIQYRIGQWNTQQSTRRNHMKTFPLQGYIKSTGRKILAIYQFEIGNINATLSCRLIVSELLPPISVGSYV